MGNVHMTCAMCGSLIEEDMARYILHANGIDYEDPLCEGCAEDALDALDACVISAAEVRTFGLDSEESSTERHQ